MLQSVTVNRYVAHSMYKKDKTTLTNVNKQSRDQEHSSALIVHIETTMSGGAL